MAFWRGELLKVIAQVKAIPGLGASIHGADEATTPADADEFALTDSANDFVGKKITWANIKVAINAVYNWATVTHAAAGKATPVDADELSIVDSAASNVIKKLTWANLKATLNASLSFYKPGGTDVAVADGGTGVSSLTAYALLAGGTTSTGAVQSVAGLGTVGDLMTSNGAGALPSFQTPAAINYGTGNAALAVGAVGTYAMLVFTGNSSVRAPGFTVAGSSLTFTNSPGVGSGGTAAGTWRLMGAIPITGTNLANTNIWLRIS